MKLNILKYHSLMFMIDVDFHRGSSKKHNDESTLKETETQRNTNLRAISEKINQLGM